MRARGTALALALLAGLLGACQGPIAPPTATLASPAVPDGCAAAREAAPSGNLTAAYPDEPAAWLPALGAEAAAVDLAALWGLPLYAHDEAGQLRPALVGEATVVGHDDGLVVRLRLCAGSWSDGRAVVPDDVVATIDALRSSPSPWRVEPIAGARVDGQDVVVEFVGEPGRWQHVLADLGTVLPAHVLAEEGLEAWRDDVPVSGGPFRLEVTEPGLRRRFVAHPDSALGAPLLAAVDVLLVPRFELALGMLVEDRADVALGHLALEAGARIDAVDGIEGAVPRGNTLLTWRWNAEAAVTDESRRVAVQEALDLTSFAQGLLGDEGAMVRSFVPGVPGPAVVAPLTLPELPELLLTAPRWHDLPSLVARGARDGLERRGATIRTATDEADALARTPLGDATITVRRLGPWPSLAALLGGRALAPEEAEVLHAADQAATRGAPAVAAGQALVWALGVEVPLVEVGVAHAWRPELAGLRPSGWPGIGFASARDWHLPG